MSHCRGESLSEPAWRPFEDTDEALIARLLTLPPGRLSAWEYGFLADLQDQYGWTPRQRAKVREIARRLEHPNGI